MKVTKVKGYLVTDQKPKIGDRTLCVNRKSSNYGRISEVHTTKIENDDWKVIVSPSITSEVNKLLAKAKRVQKEFKDQVRTHWPLNNCMSSVLEKEKVTKYTREVAMALASIPPREKVYYQPEIDEKGNIKGHPKESIFSFEVYRSKKRLMEDYPKCTPIRYTGDDIEEPAYRD
jgi:hypothetical protein